MSSFGFALRLCGFAGYFFSCTKIRSPNNVDSAFKIHTQFGPGLLESVYEAVLAHELERRGFTVVKQRAIPVFYEDVQLEVGFRADIIVNNKVLVEVKSVEALAAVHFKQVQTYLRLVDLHLGLLINFNVNLIKDGIRRVVNRLDVDSETQQPRPVLET